MPKRRVFVSFDYENDRHYKRLLEAWHANPKFQFEFNDQTPSEIDTYNIGRIKAGLTTKIRDATHTLVIVGQYANAPHPKSYLIGYKNWINFEIAQSVDAHNRLAAIRLDRFYTQPEELSGVTVSWANSFTEAEIIRALDNA